MLVCDCGWSGVNLIPDYTHNTAMCPNCKRVFDGIPAKNAVNKAKELFGPKALISEKPEVYLMLSIDNKADREWMNKILRAEKGSLICMYVFARIDGCYPSMRDK